jgi:hypothetical protein
MTVYSSVYPPAYNTTYVKATTVANNNDPDYAAWHACDPSIPLTGVSALHCWMSYEETTNQRFHIDLGSAKVVKRIYFENHHSEGENITMGIKNFTFWGSNDSGAFAELTYGTDTNWTQLTIDDSHVDIHSAADESSPEYTLVSNTIAYRYYAIKIADNWGHPVYMAVRRIELQIESGGNDSYTKLLLHMNGTNDSTTFTDSSSSAHTVTANGNAKITTAQGKFAQSGVFDGTTDYLTIPTSTDFYSNGDFTIDFWVRWATVGNSSFIGKYISGNSEWNFFYQDSKLYLQASTASPADVITPNNCQWSWTPSQDTWYHIACIRYLNTWHVYVNGTEIGEGIVGEGNIPNTNANLEIGTYKAGITHNHNGYLDEVRISQGIARWDGNFTPPTSAYSTAVSTNFIPKIIFF